MAKFIQTLVIFDDDRVKDVGGLMEEEDLENYCDIHTGCGSCVQLFDQYSVVLNNVKAVIFKTVIILIIEAFTFTILTAPPVKKSKELPLS